MSESSSDETRDAAKERSRTDETLLRSTLFGESQDFQTHDLHYPELPDCAILGVLGRGGMGIVYKARQTKLNREVAVKTILWTIPKSPMVLARFFAEAEVMAAVQHPNVAQVFDFGETRAMPYLVLELLPGGSLAQRLEGHKRLPPVDAVRLVEKLARGTGAAHDQNIVHRDLKPSNVLFDADGEPKITDFGLAKRLDSNLTLTDVQMGTPYYMAPEQANGQAKYVSPAADVWALGVMLYECLTGRRPFEGDNPPSVIHQVVNNDPPLLRSVMHGSSRDLETILQKCLAKEPHRRYATGTELADELRRWLDGQPIQARRTPPAERLILWARRKPMNALAWVLVPLTLLLGGFGLIVFNFWLKAEGAYSGEQQAKAKILQAKEQVAIVSRIRQRPLNLKPGWSWQTRDDLKAFGQLQPEAATVDDLRTDAVAALTSLDFREQPPLTTGYRIGAIARSADGRLLAVGDFKPVAWVTPMAVRFFDPTTGQETRVLHFHPHKVTNPETKRVTQEILLYLAFSPDGQRLFAGTKSGHLHYWDLTSRDATPTRTWAVGREIAGLAVARDGRGAYVLTKRGGGIHKWDIDAEKAVSSYNANFNSAGVAVHPITGDVYAGLGNFLHLLDANTLQPKRSPIEFPGTTIQHLVFHGTGTWFALGAGNQLHLVDPVTLRTTMTMLDPRLKQVAHQGDVEHLALHPSGAALISLSDDADDHLLKVWEVSTGKLVSFAPIPGEGLMSLALSADGRTIHVGTAVGTLTFEFRGLDYQKQFVRESGPVHAASFAEEGRAIAILNTRPPLDSHDPNQHVNISLVRNDTVVEYPLSVPDRNTKNSLGLTAHEGRIAITTNCPHAHLWSADRPLRHDSIPLLAASLPRFNPAGDKLWIVRDGVYHECWDAKERKVVDRWSNDLQNQLSGAAGIQAVAVGSSHVLAGTRDGGIVVVALAKPPAKVKARHLLPKLGPVTSIALSRDEKFVVAGTYIGKIRTFRLTDNVEEETLAAHTDTITAVALADTYLATGSSDRSLRLFVRDGATWRPLFRLDHLGEAVKTLDFSPDGSQLLYTCANSLGYRVLDLNALHAELAKDGFGWK